ncbi:hypothetical protein ACJW31_11G166900 [Castanea mollissima]
MKVDINENDLLLCNSLTLAIFCLLHGFRRILLPTQQRKKPNPDLNMLNYKFANKLNLAWDCDNGSGFRFGSSSASRETASAPAPTPSSHQRTVAKVHNNHRPFRSSLAYVGSDFGVMSRS